jgi:hypothetical protein
MDVSAEWKYPNWVDQFLANQPTFIAHTGTQSVFGHRELARPIGGRDTGAYYLW